MDDDWEAVFLRSRSASDCDDGVIGDGVGGSLTNDTGGGDGVGGVVTLVKMSPSKHGMFFDRDLGAFHEAVKKRPEQSGWKHSEMRDEYRQAVSSKTKYDLDGDGDG